MMLPAVLMMAATMVSDMCSSIAGYFKAVTYFHRSAHRRR